MTKIRRKKPYTVCPKSSGPFYIASFLYKMGHYFLDILYKTIYKKVLAIKCLFGTYFGTCCLTEGKTGG